MAEKKYALNPKEVEPEYQQLAGRMNYDGSRWLPRIIKKALTLEQARVALEFYPSAEEIAATLGIPKEKVDSDPQKYQVEAIVKKLKLEKETVDNHIRYMFELGFAFPTRRGWRFALNMMQLKDSMTNPKFDEQLGGEFFDLWEAFQKIEAYPTWYFQNFELSKDGPRFRIIPARKALAKSNIPYEDIVPADNIVEVLKLYSTVAVVPCACARLVPDRACHKPIEVCLVPDRVAEHNLRRGAARVVSVEEGAAIHDMATDAGAPCMPQANLIKPPMICHCHWCCCDPLEVAVMMNYPFKELIASSCYQTVVDPAKCEGCQTCVTRCQFGAIEMKRYPGAGRQEKLKSWVDPDKCLGCGLCVTTCPAEARTMKQVRTGESIPRERPLGIAYTRTDTYAMGKHLEQGSVMTRPMY